MSPCLELDREVGHRGVRRPVGELHLRHTDLGAKRHAIVGTLSRGYRQRLGVACAILHRPDIIILDEPTNGLDPTQILQMRSLIQRLAEDATVLVSTHILQEVQAVCERVLIMRQGRLALDSTLSALAQAPTLALRTGQAAWSERHGSVPRRVRSAALWFARVVRVHG